MTAADLYTSMRAWNMFQPQLPSFNGYNRDEPDNNTNHNLYNLSDLKPRYAMDDRFHREDERLKTFDNFPVDFLDHNELAMSGMFYMGETDKTKCYFCEVEIGRWEAGDQPVPEHMRWSPHCPLLRRRTTNNVPINMERLDRLLPAASYDICGVSDIEVRPNAFSEGVIPATHLHMADVPGTQMSGGASSSVSNITTTCSSSTFFPEFPEYAIETARLRSFAEWPKHMKQRPEQLAEAGFFYTGVGDRVKCFSCGGGLKDWHDDDQPWEQHALWMSKCRFLKLMKGESYIESVANKAKKTEVNTPAAQTSPTPTTASNSMSPFASPSSSSSSEEEGEFRAAAVIAAAKTAISNANAIPTERQTELTPQSLEPQASGLQNSKGCSLQATTEQRRAPSSIPEEKLCKICYANEYNTAFLPCGHVVACAKCASSVTKCPLCRKPFTDVMRVYFS